MSQRPYFARIADFYIRHRLKRSFHDVRILGATHLLEHSQSGPVVIAANHVCWWDPLVLIRLGHHFNLDGYCLMDAKNLGRLRFFRHLGALPLSPGSPRLLRGELKSALQKLKGPGSALAIFPHGAQRPAHLPLRFRSGVAALARLTGAPVLPLSLRYDFHEGPRAVVTVAFGPALRVTQIPTFKTSRFLKELEQRVSEGLALIDRSLFEPTGVQSVIHPAPVDLFAERVPFFARLLGHLDSTKEGQK